MFPQIAKINIHKITDPRKEIKSVSAPPEPALSPFANSKTVITRLCELSRRGRVGAENSTRFKFLLGHATPSHRFNARVLSLLRHHPDFAPALAGYVSKYRTIPRNLARDIANYMLTEELYHSVNADVLQACLHRMPDPFRAQIGAFAAHRILSPPRGSLPTQPSYRAALVAWALRSGGLNMQAFETLVRGERDWWGQKSMLQEFGDQSFGRSDYERILNAGVREFSSPAAQVAAYRMISRAIRPQRPHGEIDESAKRIFRAANLLRASGRPSSRIGQILSYVLNRQPTSYDWKLYCTRLSGQWVVVTRCA